MSDFIYQQPAPESVESIGIFAPEPDADALAWAAALGEDDCEFEDEPSPPPVAATPKSFALYPYQKTAVANILEAHNDGIMAVLAVSATGTGKSVMLAELTNRYLSADHKVLVLVHRDELIRQLVGSCARMGITVGVEKASENALPGFGNFHNVVCASVQTLQGDRLKRWKPDAFGLIIVDEAHHSTATSYLNILRHFGWSPNAPENGPYITGFTATPDRLDKRNIGALFQTLAFEYSLRSAVKDGYLAKPKVLQLETDPRVDLRGLKTSKGDFQPGELEDLIIANLNPLANALADCEPLQGRRAIAFFPDVESSRLGAVALEKVGITANWVSGACRDRRQKLEAHKRGDYQVLCNCMLATEGYDDAAISAVILCRPTKSRGLKCLDEQTEILTETGWKRDIAIGEQVAAFCPKSEEIVFVPAIAKVRRKLEPHEKWVSLQGPSVDIRVTDNHRMLYDNKRRLGWKFKTAGELSQLGSGCYLPVAGQGGGIGIPLTDDEIRFIAWVMTDGTIGKNYGQVSISQGAHQPWLEEIQRVIDSCGFKHKRTNRKRITPHNQTSDAVCWVISKGLPRGRDKHLRGWGDLAPFLSKDLSPLLMGMTSEQFDIFAEALHLGDGWKQSGQAWTRRSYHIATGNRTMADRLQILALMSGWRANIAEYGYNEMPLYAVHLKKQNWSQVASTYDGRPTWQILPANDERCWCVQNELGTLVTRRNGKVAIVGNSQMVGRGTRKLDGKDGCLIIDFDWLIDDKTLVKAVELFDDKSIPDDVMEVARELEENDTGVLDLEQLVERAEIIHQERVKERIRRQKIPMRGTMFDPLGLAEFFDIPTHKNGYEWADVRQATEGQLEALQKWGIDASPELPFSNAKAMLDKIITRHKHGWTSLRQINALVESGIDADVARGMRREEAVGYLDSHPLGPSEKQIKMLRWKQVPDAEIAGMTRKQASARIDAIMGSKKP